jgi:hypothetical protein
MEMTVPNSRAVSVAVAALQLVDKTYPSDQKPSLAKMSHDVSGAQRPLVTLVSQNQ